MANGNNKDSMNTIEEFTNKWVYAAQTDNERQDLKAEMKVDILALFSVSQQREYTKADLNWLMSKMKCTSERYMEAEKMIIKIIDMPWWKRLFCERKLLRFLKSRSKYNF